jgi:hypothetical protein
MTPLPAFFRAAVVANIAYPSVQPGSRRCWTHNKSATLLSGAFVNAWSSLLAGVALYQK